VRPERILYGTDFPNLPYAWDRELKRLIAQDFTEPQLAGILGQNARQLFGL
jgi:predicted TIM-barrel fold metal-dependent hydrolase